MIQYPVRAEKNPDATYACLVDASDRVIAGGLSAEDAEEIVAKLNAPAARARTKKQQIEDRLRASDLGAQLTGRTDIEYGPHDSLPRGEHVARIKKD